jgi:hypothetical protein
MKKLRNPSALKGSLIGGTGFQPVSRKQVSLAQPGKTVPPVNTSFSLFTGGAMAPAGMFAATDNRLIIQDNFEKTLPP